MMYTLSTRGTVALFIGLFASGIFSTSITSIVERDGDFLDLKAASRSSALLRRDPGIQVVRNTELSFVDSENHDTQHSIFFSRVSFESKNPFVVLEDMEHHLVDVTCNATEIDLQFLSEDTFDDAIGIFTALIGGYIITSHAGCNEDGARAPFLIQSISASNNLLLTLSTKEVPWRQAFQSFKINYGHCSERHVVRSHSTNILRRQTSPYNVPTDTPTDTTVDLDLAFQSLDSDFGLGDLNLGCKDCTTTGHLKLSQGTFEIMDLSDIVTELPNPFDVITQGSVQLDMSFGAHIELKATPSLIGVMTHILYTKPLRGFNIKNFGKAGLLFEPTLHFEWLLEGGVEVSSGFNFKIPDNSKIFLNLANPNESTVTGFDKATIGVVPFQANISDISMSMRIALRPRIAVGFSFFSDRILAEIGIHVELPNANITITQLASSSSSPKDCAQSKVQSSSLSAGDKEFQSKWSNLTHVTTSVGVAVGLDILAELEIDNFPNPKADFSHELWERFLDGPSSCLVFMGAGKDFKEAGVASAESNGKKGAAGRLVGPFGVESWYGSVLRICLYSLAITAVGFGFF